MKLLEEQIKQAAAAYYAGLPIISDAEFDKLVSDLPEGHELLTTPGWGASELTTADPSKVEINHKTLIGGLPKKKYEGEPATVYEITHKLDGITGVAYYGEDGKLENFVTRGDGNVGIRIDAAINVPDTFHPNAIIRGEVVIDYEAWLFLQEDEYKHPRNAAAGIVNRKSRDLDDYLMFIAYDWMNSPFQTQTESIEEMDDHFLCLHPVYEHDPEEYDNESQIANTFLPWKEVRKDLYVVVDGSVWRHVEKGEAKAFKYANLEVETTVKSVEWIESDRGRLHPTVHIEPVELDGATISKASGKSGKFIVDSGIGPGAIIKIRRANNVIPDIVATVARSTVLLPEVPYYWKGANMRLEEGRTMRDQLEDVCRQMILAKSKKGIAEKAINQFVKLSDALWDCEMNLEEKVGKTFNAVEQGLAAAIASDWSNYELILFCKIDGVGRRAAVSYLQSTSTERIEVMIAGSELYSTLIEIYEPKHQFPEGFVLDSEDTGQTKVCITGSLDGYTKKTFAEAYDLHLVDVKDADVVIASDTNSAKAKRAAKLEKTIMTQQQFVESL